MPAGAPHNPTRVPSSAALQHAAAGAPGLFCSAAAACAALPALTSRVYRSRSGARGCRFAAPAADAAASTCALLPELPAAGTSCTMTRCVSTAATYKIGLTGLHEKAGTRGTKRSPMAAPPALRSGTSRLAALQLTPVRPSCTLGPARRSIEARIGERGHIFPAPWCRHPFLGTKLPSLARGNCNEQHCAEK